MRRRCFGVGGDAVVYAGGKIRQMRSLHNGLAGLSVGARAMCVMLGSELWIHWRR